ncbi:MAG: hypothetical protein Q9191_006463 [Dirinaria sp. TL-2023a]
MSNPLTPEEVAYQQAHWNDNSAGGLTAFSITGSVIVLVATILRVWSRELAGISLQADDYTLIVAAVLSIIAVELTDPGRLASHATMSIQRDYTCNLFYTTGYPLSRISLVLLYRRIFVQTWFRHVCTAFVVLFTCYGISTFLVDTMAVIPARAYWDPNVTAVRSIDLVKLYRGNAGFNIATDTILLFLPLTIIWKLSMTRMQKMGISLIFCLGALTLVATIARLVVFGGINDDDITYTIVPVSWWTNAELLLGILCPCLVTFRPLLRSAHAALSSRLSSERRGYPKRGETDAQRFNSNGIKLSNKSSTAQLRGNSAGAGSLPNTYDMTDYPIKHDEEMGTIFTGEHSVKTKIGPDTAGQRAPTYRNGIEYTE